jgi:two-component SAPR family response regulator/Flp pilus assembly protein TadD
MRPLVSLPAVHLPKQRSNIITRQRLINLLESLSEHRLVLVVAPTGYGKTSLLVDFANRSPQQVCWYTIDQNDHHLAGFAGHFIAALQRVFPQFGNASLSALENLGDSVADLNHLITNIINDIYQHIRQEFLVVLDDYHQIANCEEINGFISRLIQRVDDNCHIVIAARKHPSLTDLELLSSRSMARTLTSADIAFTPEEIQMLALQNYHITLSDELANELAQETEGWITGLLLLSGKWSDTAAQIQAAKSAGANLYDYLARQVVAQQPAIIQDFLAYTALLDEFNLEICKQILEPIVFPEGTEWEGLFNTVQTENLFVVQVEENDGWLRYQSLFSGFLRSFIEQKQPETVQRIRQKAGQVYLAQGEWEKAYATCRQLADDFALADIIEKAGTAMIKSGSHRILAQWLEEIPAYLYDSRPGLISLKGAVVLMSKDFHQALPLLEQAVDQLKLDGDIQLLARTLLRRATAYHFTGNYQSALADADSVIMMVEKNDDLLPLQADGLSARGLNLFWLGQTGIALEQLRQALAIYRRIGDDYNAANVLRDLGMVYRSYGAYAFARDAYHQSLTYWLRVGNYANAATLLNNLGVLYYYDGDYEKAVQSFAEALEKARFSGYQRMEAFVLASIGDIYMDLEIWESAENVYQQSRQITQRIVQRSLLLHITLAESVLARHRDDPSLALCLLGEAEKIAEQGESVYEKGMCCFEKGRFYLASEQYDLAKRAFLEALSAFSNNHKRSDEAHTHIYLFAVEHQLANAEQAAYHLDAALEIAAQIESQHTLVMTGREVQNHLNSWMAKCKDRVIAARLLEQIKRFESHLPLLRRRIRNIHPGVASVHTKLVLQGFGEGRVYLNGKAVPDSAWEYPAGREILFYLAAHPEGATKETIGGIYWPEMERRKLTTHMKNVLYHMRQAVGGKEVILTQDDRYSFNREIDYTYDVELFDELLHKAPALPSDRRILAYREAVALYKGGFLLGIYGGWNTPEHERLWNAYGEIILKLAEHYLETKEYKLGLDYCWQALEHEPTWEPAHRMAMRIYAAIGSRGDVIGQYQMCRRALEKASGVPPSDETRQLYETLIR